MTAEHKLETVMKEYFAADFKRINHAQCVLNYSRKIMATENCDHEVVVAAAILHDIGIPEAERKFNSSAGRYQETEGPPVARKILKELCYEESFIKEVCSIIGHHHTPGIIQSQNFQVLYEADWLENLSDDFRDIPKEQKEKIIKKIFKTTAGTKLAEELYLK